MASFLLEIGLEEMPARMIAGAQAELARRVEELLRRENLAGDGFAVRSYSTPRRLAVIAEGVLAQQSDIQEELVGPSVKIAFKDGQPTQAAIAFAKKAGVEISATTTVTNSKGEYIAARVTRKGRPAADVLAAALPKEIAGIYWAKSMYWRGKPERFVRPVKWLLALLDEAVVPVEFAGVRAGNVTYGHRILRGDDPVRVESPADYLTALTAAIVMADVELRRHTIRKALDAATRALPNMRWREDEALVDIVTHLTEWPSVVLGSFEPEYLSLPEEVLVTVMRDHQKYFAVEDAEGKLAPHFLAVLNTEAGEAGNQTIRHGNERVLRARFNDARFFWDFDQKISLADRVEMLKNVTFQKDLGSYHEKTQKVIGITELLFITLNAQKDVDEPKIDEDAAAAAAELLKADLTTELVKEFPELQGKIGGIYARMQGNGDLVADCIYAQYDPQVIQLLAQRHPESPETVAVVSLADRLDTIVGMFSVGLEPTGSKDPFALRRAGNDLVQILSSADIYLNIRELIEHTQDEYPDITEDTKSKLVGFFRERIGFFLHEVRGFRYDVVNAVLAAEGTSYAVKDIVRRAEAISAMLSSQEFLAVVGGVKRMRNLLRQAEKEIFSIQPFEPERATPEEVRLFEQVELFGSKYEEFVRFLNYEGALVAMSVLRPEIDEFFNKVMVMVDDEDVRARRLGLLRKTVNSFSRMADFSEIVVS